MLQACFSEFLNEIELGTWIPLGVFVLRDSHRSKMSLDLIYGYSKPLEKASYYTKSKGRKEESIGRVFKKLILVKSSYT